MFQYLNFRDTFYVKNNAFILDTFFCIFKIFSSQVSAFLRHCFSFLAQYFLHEIFFKFVFYICNTLLTQILF